MHLSVRRARIVMWAALFVVDFGASSTAAPVAAAVGAIGAWYATLGFAGQLLVQVAIAAVAFGIEYLLSGSGARVAAATGDQQIASITPERDGLLTVRRAYGETVSAGAVFFQTTVTGAGHTGPNVYLLGLALSEGVCDSVASVIINGVECTLDPNGNPQVAPWYDVSGNLLQVSFRNGSDTQAIDPLISSYFPTPPSDFYPDLDSGTRTTNWANFCQKGVATVVLAMQYGADANAHQALWGAGGIPQIVVRLKGLRVYDRSDSNQDPNDPSTWFWRDTATVIIEDYLVTDIGGQIDRSEINDAEAKTSIAIDKTWVPTLTGQEQGGRINGIVYSTDVNADVLTSMAQQNRGIISKQFGEYIIRADRAASPVATIHAGLLYNEGSFSYRNEPDTRALTTGVVSQFYPASRFGQDAQVAYPNAALDDQAAQQVTLKYCDSPSAAQRLDYALYTESNIGRTISGDFLPAVLVAPGRTDGLLSIGDVVWVDFPSPYDTINGLYRIDQLQISSAFIVTLSMSGTTADIINGWSTALETAFSEVA